MKKNSSLFIVAILNLLLLQTAKADILLVPEKLTQPDDYRTICIKNKYDCFPSAFTKVFVSQSTSLETLLNEFDLDNLNYLSDFYEQTKTTLSNEPISAEQVNKLILALEKIHTNEKVNTEKINTLIINITDLKKNLDSEVFNNFETGIFILGRLINNSDKNRSYIKNLENNLGFKIKSYIVSYNEYTDGNKTYPYLKGNCDKPDYDLLINNKPNTIYMPYFVSGCSFTEKYKWGGNLLAEHFNQHQKKYYWATGVIIGLIFAKKYDIAIEIH